MSIEHCLRPLVYTEVAIPPTGTIFYVGTPNSSLRIRDVYPGSNFSIPDLKDPGTDSHPHQRIFIFDPKTVSKLPDPDPGVKKALDPGSATLRHTVVRSGEIVTFVTGKLCRTYGHKKDKRQKVNRVYYLQCP